MTSGKSPDMIYKERSPGAGEEEKKESTAELFDLIVSFEFQSSKGHSYTSSFSLYGDALLILICIARA